MKITRYLTKLVYRFIAKHLLFMSAPDDTHNHLLKLGSYVQKNKLLLGLIRWAWSYDNPDVLEQNLHGVKFINPIGLAAGFDKNIQLPPLMKAVGFGFMTGGSITAGKTKGNPRPWFRRLPKLKSLAVNAGLPNDGSLTIIRRIKTYADETFDNFPLMISVALTNNKTVASHKQAIDDYIKSLKRVNGLSQMIEINISCPNARFGQLFTDPGALEELLTNVDSLNLQKPIFIKMPGTISNEIFLELLKTISEHKIVGVTVCNLNKDYSGFKVPENTRGGLSGKPAYERSNELIKLTYERYGDRLTIIGVGGVFSPEDAYMKLRLGASFVGLITGIIYQGPQLVGDICQGLVALLEKDGFTHISQIIGVDTNRGNL